MAKSIAKAIKKYISQLQLNTISTDTNVVEVEDDGKKEEVVVEEKEEETKKEDILFKIQIASSKKRIKTKSYNFKGLRNVERVKVGRYYKYYYGHSDDYKKTKAAFDKAKKKGYKSAFIVAFKEGKKISLAEALK